MASFVNDVGSVVVVVRVGASSEDRRNAAWTTESTVTTLSSCGTRCGFNTIAASVKCVDDDDDDDENIQVVVVEDDSTKNSVTKFNFILVVIFFGGGRGCVYWFQR